MFGPLLHHRAQILPIAYSTDKSGGEIQSAPLLLLPTLPDWPCAVQEGSAPTDNPGGQGRRRSTTEPVLFFATDPGVVEGDRVRVVVKGRERIFTAIAEAKDNSGQAGGFLSAAVLWELRVSETT